MAVLKWLESIEPQVSSYLSGIAAGLVLFLALLLVKRILCRRLESRSSGIAPVGFDPLLREWARSTKVYFLFALSIYVAALFFPLEAAKLQVLHRAVILVALIQFGIWANLAINFWIENVLRKRATYDAGSATTLGLISFAAKALLILLVFLLILNNLGVNITALIAGLGVGGVALALAVQNILGDLFASLTIVLDKPFVVGDFVVVSEFMGTIEHIGLKTTRIRSLSGEQLIFSNSDLLKSRIRNFKRMNERRVVFSLAVAEETSLELLREIPTIVQQTIKERQGVRFDRCHLLRVLPHALEYEIVYWVTSPDFNRYADLAQEIYFGVIERFRASGIRFAMPTTKMVTESMPSTEGSS